MCFQLTPEYLLCSLKNTIKKQQTSINDTMEEHYDV